MNKIRSIIIGAVAILAPLSLVTAPAGASTSHAKFIKASKAWVPNLRGDSGNTELEAGEYVCSILRKTGEVITTVGIVLANVPANINGEHAYFEVADTVGVSVLELCPSYEGAVRTYNASGGLGVALLPTTNSPTRGARRDGGIYYLRPPTPKPLSGYQDGKPVPSPDKWTAGEVCASLGQGQSATQVVTDVYDAVPNGDDVPWVSVLQFVDGAVSSKCPKFTSSLDTIQHGSPGVSTTPTTVAPPIHPGVITCTYSNGVLDNTGSDSACIGVPTDALPSNVTGTVTFTEGGQTLTLNGTPYVTPACVPIPNTNSCEPGTGGGE